MIRRKASFILFLVVAFVSTSSIMRSSAYAEQSPRQITVIGEAEKNYSPNKVDIFAVVEGRGKTVQEAKNNHDELLRKMHEVVKNFDIPADGVKTLSNSINPQYDYIHDAKGAGKQVLRGYSAEHRIQITLLQLKKTGDFVNGLVSAGIDRIEQMNYGLQNSDNAEMEVTIAAVKDAKNKAQQIVNALESNLGKVLTVNLNAGGYQPMPVPMMAMAKTAPRVENMSDTAAAIPSGDVNIRKDVTVQFEIQ